MILGNASDLSALLAPADRAANGADRTNFGRRFIRGVLIVTVAAFWIWGLVA